MSETISKIANTIRNVVRQLGEVMRRASWLAPVAILAVFFVL